MATRRNALLTCASTLVAGVFALNISACDKSTGHVSAEQVSYAGHASGDRVSSALDNLADEVGTLNDRVTSLETAAKASGGRKRPPRGQDVETRLAQLEAALAERNQAFESLQAKLETALAARDQTIATLQGQVDALSQEVDALTQQVDALQNPAPPACPDGMELTKWGTCIDTDNRKGTNGEVLYLTWYQALIECGVHQARLCTAAEIIESMGTGNVKGIGAPDPDVEGAEHGLWVADMVPGVDIWADGFEGAGSGSLFAAFISSDATGGLDRSETGFMRRFRCCYDP